MLKQRVEKPTVSTKPVVRSLFLNRTLVYHGGVAKVFLYFARCMDRLRVSMVVGSLTAPSPEMLSEFDQLGVPVHTLGDKGYVRPALNLRRILKKNNINVCVCSSLKAYLIGKLATFGTPCRVVYRIPAIPLVMSNYFRILIYQVLSRRDTLVFNSKAVEKEHYYPRHEGRARVVYNGVEPPSAQAGTLPYPKTYRQQLDIPFDATVIGYTAEFIGWKDHPTLLQAFARVANARPDLHLILIGTGERFEYVHRLAESLPNRERVHFLGARPDARRLLGIMDMYAHVSNGEGFGLAVVEAMLAGLPVIAANAGSLPELIRHQDTGLLFEAGNVGDLADKIEALRRDQGFRERIAARGRSYCLKHFSPQRFAEELTLMLEEELA